MFPDTATANHAGHLQIGGVDVVDLAREFGTPLYVFDEATLRARCREFVREFSSRQPETLVAYASKAYLNPALAALFAEEGLGLDVVSGGELLAGLKGGMPAERVYLHGNNKSRDELALALAQGCGRVVVDNLEEITALSEMAATSGRRQEVLVRVTPGVDPHTHRHTTTGIVDSKFGLPLETGQAEEAVRSVLSSPGLRLVGLHFHLGSPIFETEPYTVALRRALEFAAARRADGLELRELSPGGGFATRYTRDDKPPAVSAYASAIVSTLHEECRRFDLALPRLVVEPGRSITGPAAVTLYRVGSVKEIPATRTYVAVDGGMGDNIRPSLYGAAYEAVAADRLLEPHDRTAAVAGRFCESGDVLIRECSLPRLAAGDLVAVATSGAYNPSMASNYNLTPRPAAVLVRDGTARLIRRRETYEDLMRMDVW